MIRSLIDGGELTLISHRGLRHRLAAWQDRLAEVDANTDQDLSHVLNQWVPYNRSIGSPTMSALRPAQVETVHDFSSLEFALMNVMTRSMERLLVDLIEIERLLHPSAATEADIRAQRDLAAEFDAAINAGELQRFLVLYAEDAVRLPPGSDPIVGREAIAESIQGFLEAYQPEHALEVEDVRVSGDVAISRGNWRSTDTPRSGGESSTARGTWTTFRERTTDGSWKTVLEIWNRGS